MNEGSLSQIVMKTRGDFEQGLVDEKKLTLLYCEYASIPEPDAFVRAARRMFPSLNCGLASVYLRDKMGEGKIVQGKYDQHPHTYLQISDGRIIDITADQYGGPRIYIGERVFPWQ